MSSFFLRTLLEASSFRSVQNTNGTALMDDDVVGSVLKNATTIMDTASRSSSDEPSFDWSSFFWSWGINLLLLIIIMGLTVYCWKINGCARFYTVQTHETDLIYQRNQLEREQQQRERKVLSPEQRTKMLMESFERTKAISTVQDGDFVEEHDVIEHDQQQQQQQKTPAFTFQKSNVTDDIESGSSDGFDVPQTGLANDDDSEHNETPPFVLTSSSSSTSLNDEQQSACLHDLEIGETDNHDDDDQSEAEQEDYDCENGYVRVGRRLVPNCCAICLCEYEVCDKIVSSVSCKHVFHLDCMVHWLVKMQSGTPCPVCRQDFTDLVEHKRERRIRWAADTSFDHSAIVWSR